MKPKPSLCCYCGHFLECAMHPVDDTREPTPGDFSMCINCGGLLCFNEDMTLRGATLADRQAMEPDQAEMLKLMEASRAAVRHAKDLQVLDKPKRRTS